MFQSIHTANKLQMITAIDTIVIKFLKTYGNRTRDARFCDAVTNTYYKMVLKFFINNVEKYVKKAACEGESKYMQDSLKSSWVEFDFFFSFDI